MFGPRRTFQSVCEQIVLGLEDGTVVLPEQSGRRASEEPGDLSKELVDDLVELKQRLLHLRELQQAVIASPEVQGKVAESADLSKMVAEVSSCNTNVTYFVDRLVERAMAGGK